MQSRRDQVDAYLHLQSRLESALVSGQPDAVESPTRRDRMTNVAGMIFAVIIIIVAVVVGVLFGSDRPLVLTTGEVILDAGTGGRYLVIGDVLHPLANLTSVRLLTGEDPKVRSVKSKLIADLPRGGPIGLPGAPDTLPAARVLNQGQWLSCSLAASGQPAQLLVRLGPPIPTVDLGADYGVLATDGTETDLLWRGLRLRVPGPHVAGVLGYGGVGALPVDRHWLASVPAGPDLLAPAVPGQGRPGPAIEGRRSVVGQLFRFDGAGAKTSYYLNLADGLAPLTDLDALLAQADPSTGQGTPIELSAAQLNAARIVPIKRSGAFPAVTPRLTGPPTGLSTCLAASATGDDPTPQLVFARVAPLAVGIARAPPLVVRVQAGAGALVRRKDATVALVTPEGSAFPVTDVTDLGYRTEQVVSGLDRFVDQLPRGPTLSGTSGRRGATGTRTVEPASSPAPSAPSCPPAPPFARTAGCGATAGGIEDPP